MEKIKILVCTHKKSPHVRTSSPYFPLQLGKTLHPDIDLGFATDNTGDNISDKNESWSELTGLYWGWKNINDTQYLGLAHYRRYFDIEINEDNVDSLMDGYDMLTVTDIVGSEFNMNQQGLIMATSQEDFYIFLDTLIEMRPECKQGIIDYFYNYNKFVSFTMFLAKKNVYDDFCNFIFPVLFEVEKRILPRHYSRQKRVIGYFGEWSLGLYILSKKLRVRKAPWIMCDDDYHEKHTSFTHNLSFFYLKLKMWKKKHSRKPIMSVLVPNDILTGFKKDGIALHTLK